MLNCEVNQGLLISCTLYAVAFDVVAKADAISLLF